LKRRDLDEVLIRLRKFKKRFCSLVIDIKKSSLAAIWAVSGKTPPAEGLGEANYGIKHTYTLLSYCIGNIYTWIKNVI
jgi:hypothetical protein